MLQVRDGSCKHKYVTLTYSFIKFTDVPLFILHVATCIQTFAAEILGPKNPVLVPCVVVSGVLEGTPLDVFGSYYFMLMSC
jgi:hypothetical protein